MSEKQRWVPLESNPEVMNKFLTNVGVPEKWRMSDVYGLDPELLAMVPRPVLALLLLFPINEKFEAYFKEEQKTNQEISPDVYFMKQTVGNACGTIALIHSVANNLDTIELAKESILQSFIKATQEMDADQRAAKLETDVGLSTAHEESAAEGQTEAPDRDDKVDLHFIAFVAKNGSLYQLDGRQDKPINHGPTSRETFLEDAAQVCRRFMAVDPDEVHFTLVALTSASDNE